MILLLFFTSVLLWLTWEWWKNRKLPPGPWGLPVLGYLTWLDAKAPYATLTKLAEKYGPVYSLSLGSVKTVVITDPKIVKKVFAKDATTGRAPLYVTHGIMQGYGLICAEGDLWKDQRKFVFGCLRQLGGSKIGTQREKMQNLILAHVHEFIRLIQQKGNKVENDPSEPLRHAMGSAINIIVFGKSWPRDDETWKWLQYLQEEGTKLMGVAAPCNFLPFLRYFSSTQKILNFLLDGKNKTHELYQQIIDEQVTILDELMKKPNFNPNEACSVLQAFLLERKKRSDTEEFSKFYNDRQFHHLLADMFGAGLDTTLTTLRWYLLHIAVHKNVQKKVRDELNVVLEGRQVTITDFIHLPYTEASICEAQRIRSVVPVGIPHGTLEEVEIEGYLVPKSTMIVPLQWGIHMSERYWSHPEQFDPTRFLNEEGKVVKPEAFLPFQAGKRMCVGDELARMLLFLFGATIIQNFDISVENIKNVDLTGECGITLTPKPHKLIFTSLKED